MRTSQLGIDLIQHFESCFLKAYKCPADVWTIGWGTIEYPDGRKVKEGDTCTQVQANTYFEHEMAEKEKAVAELVDDIDIKPYQFDALVSFAYNCGIDALTNSTLLRRIRENPSNYKAIVGSDDMDYRLFAKGGQFIRWNKVKGVADLGIIRRRKAEAWLYATGTIRLFEEMIGFNKAKIKDLI